MALYLGSSFYREEPEGNEVGGVGGPSGDGAREHGGPGFGAVHRGVAVLSREVLADRVALVLRPLGKVATRTLEKGATPGRLKCKRMSVPAS